MLLPLSQLIARQPLATTYVTHCLQQQRLPHALLLTGPDASGAYQLFLSLAQRLLCQTAGPDDVDACGHCQACRWVAQNAHPEVITLTRFTYQSDEQRKSTATPKTISTEQVGQLCRQLALTSTSWRVVWLSDAEQRPAEQISPAYPPPYDWHTEHGEKKHLHLKPLTLGVFSEKAVNQMLKPLEEPHARTLFVFYSDSERQVLPTIVSRCQVLPLQPPPAQEQAEHTLTAEQDAWLTAFFERWLVTQDDRFALVDDARQFWEQEHALPWAEVLPLWQHWVLQRWRNGHLPLPADKLVALQQKLQTAQRWAQVKVQPAGLLWWVLAAPLQRQQWG